jgi:hypothetical protein
MKYIVTIVFALAIVLYACTKDVGMLPQAVQLSDSTLFKMATTTTPYSYKAGTGDTTFTSSNSVTFGAHPTDVYSLRANKKAKDAMTASGKLPVNGTFPDSTLLVKKLYTSFPGQVDQYAVMYKINSGWIWAKYDANGGVLQSFKADASSCVGCHPASGTGVRDHVNTFDLHQ